MEILHTTNLLKVEIPLENIEVKDVDKRNTFVDKTPTRTLPFLETKDGVISQSGAIIYYLCEKNKSTLLGQNALEKAKIMQWVEFANCEIMRCNRSIIYPVLGWDNLNKDVYNKESNKLKDYLKLLEKELENKLKTLQVFIDKMEDLINELIIHMGSNKEDDTDINNLFKDMDDLIDSVKDY